MQFLTKADTLRMLESRIQGARILPQVCFTTGEFSRDPTLPGRLLQEAGLLDQPLIVRSSAQTEDTAETSNAGRYLSLGNVQGRLAVTAAVEQVVEAMGPTPDNQVFIQPYLEQVTLCGVAFTTDPNTMGNYYVLNYDDETGSTSSVTGGTGAALKTYYCFKSHRDKAPAPLGEILAACAELEGLFGNPALDIEFAIAQGTLYLLQVRPLVLGDKPVDLAQQTRDLACIHRKLATAGGAQPNLLGERAIYGVMPDWNPAEMIGIRPRPLALSLYKELITNGVWAYQRDNYGYRNLRSFPLMLDFCGLPYIDTRVSFNSFVPKALPDDLARKLVDYYLDQLREDPSKHDKVEFDIAFTCYTLDLQERIAPLDQYGFSAQERETIVDSLRELTNSVLDSRHGLWKKDVEKIDILRQKHKTIMDSDLEGESKLYWLLEYCKRYGTLPFAGLARAGFIAVEFLKSMVRTGILSEEEKNLFMSSLSTVGKNISQDFTTLSPAAFLRQYGHLRPGTYDICSPRYDQAGEAYFNFNRENQPASGEQEQFKLSIDQLSRFQQLLEERQLQTDVLQMFAFIRQAIEGREYSKFVFTQTLSDALELLARLGEKFGLSREDMSYAEIQPLLQTYSAADDLGEVLRVSIAKGRAAAEHTAHLTLPPVIGSPEQIYQFFLPDGAPSFITQKTCTAATACLPDETDLMGKIVLVRSADPGYDWIFSHGIAGFITAYGGANSHMAIRSAEFGLPAVIGVGEKLFQSYAQSKLLTVDCQNRVVQIHR